MLKKVVLLLVSCFAVYLSGCSPSVETGNGNDSGVITPTQSASSTQTTMQNETPQQPGIAEQPGAAAKSDEAKSPDLTERHNKYTASDDSFNIFYFKDDGTEFTPIPPTWVEITAQDGTEVKLIVSGKELTIDGQPPIVKDGEVFVPIHGVFEHVTGAYGDTSAPFMVNWDAAASTATITNSWFTVIIKQGEQNFTLNIRSQGASSISNESITPDSPAQIINGELMLPLKAITEAIDMILEWDEQARAVSIFYPSVIATSGPRQ